MRARLAPSLIAVIALLGPVLAWPADEERRFDVAVTEAPARAFFEGLVEGTAYNVVFEPGINGTVSLRMHAVTVIEALDAVRDAYGYDYRRIPSGFVIVPPSIQTRIFQVNYLDLERRGTSRTRVSSGQPSQTPLASTQGVPTGSAGTAPTGGASNGLSEPPGEIFSRDGSGTGQNRQVSDINGSSISTRTASDFWGDLMQNLQALVPQGGGREIVVSPASGVIAVRAMPGELRDVQKFLENVQDVSTREVVLEAKVVEVQLSDGLQAGINWSALAKQASNTLGLFQSVPQGQGGFNNSNLLVQPGQSITLQPGSNPLASLPVTTLGGAFSLALNTPDFSAFLDLLATQGKTRVLSSPRVSTLNNQKAVIKAGTDQFFVTGVQSSTVVGTASATSNNVQLTPFFSGVALDVTPQISADGNVLLHIHPTISDVTQQVQNLTVDSVNDSLPLALSQVRESDSVVRAKSGQVIVIGGLMRTTGSDTNYRTPVLGDIPLLGNLFNSKQRMTLHSELVILLRPIVVQSDEQWQQLAKAALEPAEQMDPKASIGEKPSATAGAGAATR